MSKAVQEVVSHGDTNKVRYIEVDLTSIDSVIDMLNTCSYLHLPDSDFGKDAAFTSRTYDEIVAARRVDAERVARELVDNGTAEIGWVEYRVMPRYAKPILQAKGWPSDKIERCFA